jgi:hypothetical protein
MVVATAGHVSPGEAARETGKTVTSRSKSSTSTPSSSGPRRRPQRQQQSPELEEQGASGFSLTLQNLTPQIMRRLQIPSGQSGAVVADVVLE